MSSPRPILRLAEQEIEIPARQNSYLEWRRDLEVRATLVQAAATEITEPPMVRYSLSGEDRDFLRRLDKAFGHA